MNSQPAWLAEYDAQQEDCRLKMVTILEEFGSLEKLVETLKVAGSGGCCSGGKRSALEQRVEDKISLISKCMGVPYVHFCDLALGRGALYACMHASLPPSLSSARMVWLSF